MPIDNQAYSIGTASATKIVAFDSMEQNVLIHNNGTGEETVYIGGASDVDSTNGTILVAEERISIDLGAGDEVFAIGSVDNINVRVMRVTQD